jgi:beclin 1
MASNEAAVDHPLCRECAAALRRELEARAAEAERDCAAYETLLAELAAEEEGAMPADAFAREMAQLDAAADAEEARLAADVAALAEAEGALAAARAASRALDEAEAAHEADVEEHALQAAALQDDTEAVEARIRAAQAQLELLRRTHVFNEAFHIWHDGPFGTISGFRLGRTAAAPVEWDEINAAWGQACLLLATMSQVARVQFVSHALVPMGSTSRVRDLARGGTYDLFGPVSTLNLLAAQRFDRAQLGFLACLGELAAFAGARDAAAGVRPPFELPYSIDGDKVDGRSVRFTLSRDDKWTAALKLLLTDLKVLLSWLSRNYLDRDRDGGASASASGSGAAQQRDA